MDLSNRQLGPVAYGEAGWTLSRGLEAERQRAQGEWLVCGVKEKHRKRGGKTGPQAASPVFVYNKKPLFDVAADPLLQTRLLLLKDVPWVRCQTQTEDWKTCTPRNRSGHRILTAHYPLLLGRSSLSSWLLQQKLDCYPAKPFFNAFSFFRMQPTWFAKYEMPTAMCG